jgi:hypothetical protein
MEELPKVGHHGPASNSSQAITGFVARTMMNKSMNDAAIRIKLWN